MKLGLIGSRPPRVRPGEGRFVTPAQKREYAALERSAAAFVELLSRGIIHMPGDVARMLPQRPGNIRVVSGDGDGLDKFIMRHARAYGFVVESHPANYNKYSSAEAPLVRNSDMVASLTLEIEQGGEAEFHAWPGSWARGTWDTVTKAKKAKVPVYLWQFIDGAVRVRLAT